MKSFAAPAEGNRFGTIAVTLAMAWIVTVSPAWPADSVAVIPLATGSAKGMDKQVQYNDGGRTAGAELYYDKASSSLGVGTDLPAYLVHVRGERNYYLAGMHNTSTGASAAGLVVRTDGGGNPLLVQHGSSNLLIVGSAYTSVNTKTLLNDAVAIGLTMPTYTLTVNGTAGKPGGGSWADTSDRRLKKNIARLERPLEKISRLQGVSFQWVNPGEHGGQQAAGAGFLAQDLEKVFPEWITEVDPVGKDRELVGAGEKVKSLSLPHGFSAYLVEAIKELRAENEALKELVCNDHPAAALCRSR